MLISKYTYQTDNSLHTEEKYIHIWMRCLEILYTWCHEDKGRPGMDQFLKKIKSKGYREYNNAVLLWNMLQIVTSIQNF